MNANTDIIEDAPEELPVSGRATKSTPRTTAGETVTESASCVIDLNKVGHRELQFLLHNCGKSDLLTGLVEDWAHGTPRITGRPAHRNEQRRRRQRKHRYTAHHAS